MKSCHSCYPDRTTFDILLKFSIHSKGADMERVLHAVYQTIIIVTIHYTPEQKTGRLFVWCIFRVLCIAENNAKGKSGAYSFLPGQCHVFLVNPQSSVLFGYLSKGLLHFRAILCLLSCCSLLPYVKFKDFLADTTVTEVFILTNIIGMAGFLLAPKGKVGGY